MPVFFFSFLYLSQFARGFPLVHYSISPFSLIVIKSGCKRIWRSHFRVETFCCLSKDFLSQRYSLYPLQDFPKFIFFIKSFPFHGFLGKSWICHFISSWWIVCLGSFLDTEKVLHKEVTTLAWKDMIQTSRNDPSEIIFQLSPDTVIFFLW